MKTLYAILTLLLFSFTTSFADVRDSLVLKNGNVIVGEIKSMDLGVLQIETPYSDADFKIEWTGVQRLYTETTFLITLEDGSRYTASLQSVDDDAVQLTTQHGISYTTPLSELVYLKGVEDGFLSRLSAQVDLGFSLTKARSQQQVTLNSRVGYLAETWSLDGYYNDLFSSQDSTASIRRSDYGAAVRYLLPADWYLSADVSFLSNTEQALQLRSNVRAGAGNYVVHTNRALWGIGGGIATNFETFSNDTDSRNSIESFMGTEVNLFDFGDLSLFSSLYAYRSITESGRWRADGRADVKYDLPLDFYIRAGLTLNYDNQPAISGREVDYIFTTGFGWEW